MLIRHTLQYLPAQLLSPLAQLVSVVMWTHWLAPSEMGFFTLVTVTQEMAYLGGLGWFAVYALRYLPPEADRAGRGNYLATENVVVLASMMVSAAAAAALAWALPGDRSWPATTAALAAFLATKGIGAHYAERARAQSAFVAFSVLQIAGPVGGLGLGWLALQSSAPSAAVLLAAYALAQALGLLLAVPGLGMRWRLGAPDPAVLRAALAFGAPVLMLSALGWVAENYIRYLVQWHSGATTLGLMVVGWSLGRRCAAVASTLVTTASFPLASRLLNERRPQAARALLGLNAALMVAVLLPVSAALQFLGPALVGASVAPGYRAETTELLGLAVLAGAIRNLHMHTTDQLMVLERRIGMLARVSAVEIALCLVASLIGLEFAGPRGAVIGQAAGSLVALCLSVAWARTRLGFHWPWADSARIGLATAAMTVALGIGPAATGVRGLGAGVALGAAVYLGACALLFVPQLRRLQALGSP